MPIQLTGQLTVVERSGRHGRFCVGNLVTDIGEFVVKDAALEQFGAGTYTGRFVVTQIFLKTYAFQNRLFTDIQAKLSDIQIDLDGVLAGHEATPPSSEPDPIEDAPSQALTQVATAPEASLPVEAKPHVASDDLTSLYGEEIAGLIRQRLPVKLDAAVDRPTLRRQCARLNATRGGDLNYFYDATDSTWYPQQ